MSHVLQVLLLLPVIESMANLHTLEYSEYIVLECYVVLREYNVAQVLVGWSIQY